MSFFNRNKERIILSLVSIILIIMIGITSSERISLTKVEIITGNVLTPIGKLTSKISQNTNKFLKDIRDIPVLREENKSLKEQIAELENENRTYKDIIGKTDYLKREQELLKTTEFILLQSQIVGKEPGNWFDRFTLDKGSKDGVKKGDTVVEGIEIEQGVITEGIVGRVVDVGDNWAKVVTIIDEISLAFKIIRTQDGGIVSGNINGKVTGYLFDDKSDIIKGDKLLTSGLGESYAKDIYIGEVEEVISEDNDLMKEILIRPAIDFKKLYRVYVIIGNEG